MKLVKESLNELDAATYFNAATQDAAQGRQNRSNKFSKAAFGQFKKYKGTDVLVSVNGVERSFTIRIIDIQRQNDNFIVKVSLVNIDVEDLNLTYDMNDDNWLVAADPYGEKLINLENHDSEMDVIIDRKLARILSKMSIALRDGSKYERPFDSFAIIDL